ncbi:hypothetical protein DFH06DRAFT_1335594 [Mycena polygramma]|nr:hypothetical protein DFH06DRAFT_1335594 [Mycena polygramma]
MSPLPSSMNSQELEPAFPQSQSVIASPTGAREGEQSGMERGYAMSPMAELVLEFNSQTDTDVSLFMRTTSIISKKNLEVSDVMDRGVSTTPQPMERFGLETGFSIRTIMTIVEMQKLLTRASALVRGRTTCFQIDPHKVISSVLKSAHDLNELHVAWAALSERMALAQNNFRKYQSEFSAEKEEDILLSPVSTLPEVYSVFPRGKSPASDLNYLMDNVPHHRKLWPKGYNVATDWLPHIMTAPQYLEEAFPDRPREDRPSTVYYSAEGDRREIVISSRSSHGAGPDFTVPPVSPRKGKEKQVSGSQEENFDGSPRASKSPAPPLSSPKPSTSEPLRNWSSSNAALLGPNIPFKEESNFFGTIPRSRQGEARASFVPSSPLPNPLQGMATVGSYSALGDSISQFKRPGTGARKAPALPKVSEGDEGSNNEQRQRDLPPHMSSTGVIGHRTGTSTVQAPPVSVVQPEGRKENQPRREDEERGGGRSRDNRKGERAGGGHPSDSSDSDGDGDDDDRGRRGNARREHPPRRSGRRAERSRSAERRETPPPPLSESSDPSSEGDGSGGGGGGGPAYIDQRFPYIAPGAPYGVMVPTIEPKLKVETLPEWDGNHDTAIDYFWEVGHLATLQGWLPQALGFWLPSRLKKGSAVQLWFTGLSLKRQAEMREHYLTYLQVIKDRYLGRKWQLKMNIAFEQQLFRQKGHEDETPQSFLGRRIRSVRMLANADDGGPLEVYLVMRKAPIKWSTILVLENIQSSEELYDKVNEHEEELVEAAKHLHADAVTSANLVSTLRRLGVLKDSPMMTRRANLTTTDDGGQEEGQDAPEQTLLQEPDAADGEDTLKQVYQTLKRRQRPPPKGGYPFSKNDHVTTKMGKAPPSPCKVCGSANHWDRECPDWNVYIERQKRGVLIVATSPASEEAELMYHSAYVVLLEGRMSESSF